MFHVRQSRRQRIPSVRERTRQGEEARKVLDELGLKRYCCRRMILSHAELIDEVLPFG